MNIIEKKKHAMDKIMAIPLGDWKESENHDTEGRYVTNYNGHKIAVSCQGTDVFIFIDRVLFFPDSRVSDLYFNLAFHFSDDKKYIETALDDIGK